MNTNDEQQKPEEDNENIEPSLDSESQPLEIQPSADMWGGAVPQGSGASQEAGKQDAFGAGDSTSGQNTFGTAGTNQTQNQYGGYQAQGSYGSYQPQGEAMYATDFLPPEKRTTAAFIHGSGMIASFFFGLTVLGPLIAYFAFKDDPYLRPHAVDALNFSILIIIINIVAVFTFFLIVPILIAAAASIAYFVFAIIGVLKALEGQRYLYPFSIKVVA